MTWESPILRASDRKYFKKTETCFYVDENTLKLYALNANTGNISVRVSILPEDYEPLPQSANNAAAPIRGVTR